MNEKTTEIILKTVAGSMTQLVEVVKDLKEENAAIKEQMKIGASEESKDKPRGQASEAELDKVMKNIM